MADVLSVFLRAVAERPHLWGESDCVMTQFAWVRQRTGIDPAAIVGAAWHGEREARAVIAATGGVLDGGRELYARCGLAETVAPVRGDIGVIETGREGQVLHVAAICTGARWAWPAEPRGIAMARGIVRAAWAVGVN